MDYREFVAAHRAAGADITVAALPCAEEQAQAFGLMKIDDRWAGELGGYDLGLGWAGFDGAAGQRGSYHMFSGQHTECVQCLAGSRRLGRVALG